MRIRLIEIDRLLPISGRSGSELYLQLPTESAIARLHRIIIVEWIYLIRPIARSPEHAPAAQNPEIWKFLCQYYSASESAIIHSLIEPAYYFA